MPYRAAILTAIESLRDLETGSSISSIRRHVQDNDQDDETKWNENLFQETIKSLVRQGEIVQLMGANYKFTDGYMDKRAEALSARAELIRHRSAAVSTHHAAGMGSKGEHVAEGKESPKKKTVHAKVKIGEGEIITVVIPEKKRQEGMEVDEEDEGMDGTCADAIEDDRKGGKKKRVKIVPKKVLSKKMIKDQIMTT